MTYPKVSVSSHMWVTLSCFEAGLLLCPAYAGFLKNNHMSDKITLNLACSI